MCLSFDLNRQQAIVIIRTVFKQNRPYSTQIQSDMMIPKQDCQYPNATRYVDHIYFLNIREKSRAIFHGQFFSYTSRFPMVVYLDLAIQLVYDVVQITARVHRVQPWQDEQNAM